MSLLFNSILLNSVYTAIIVIFIGVLFLLQRKWINRSDEKVKRWSLVLLYILLFLLFISAIVGILIIWNFDFTFITADFLKNLEAFVQAKTGAIFGTIFVFFLATFILKVAKIALLKVGQKESPLQKRKKTIAKVTMSIVRYSTYIISIIVILAFWGVNVVPALAGLGMVGLVIGLGAQKFINDLISGFFIIFEHHFDVGDKIEVGGFKGEVKDIGLKTTKILGWRGDVKIIANGDITTLINYSRNPSIGIVDFGIAYKEDAKKTIDLLTLELPKMKLELEDILEDPQVVGVTDLASSSVNIRVIVKTVTEKHYAVERAIRLRIKEILDANGIEIPFPQVVLHQPKE